MSLKVIGVGVGRTGTFALKHALERLGMGPCYHMMEVMVNRPEHKQLWKEALNVTLDLNTLFKHYGSTADWPAATYYRELYHFYPKAKFVLTVCDPESWAHCFHETIDLFLRLKADTPPPTRNWLNIIQPTIEKSGFKIGSSVKQLAQDFLKHNEAAKATLPQEQLLVFDVKDGWDPLCEFLGCEVPQDPFPKGVNTDAFWEAVKRVT